MLRSDSNIKHRTSILRSQQKYSNFITISIPKQLIQFSPISILLILLILNLLVFLILILLIFPIPLILLIFLDLPDSPDPPDPLITLNVLSLPNWRSFAYSLLLTYFMFCKCLIAMLLKHNCYQAKNSKLRILLIPVSLLVGVKSTWWSIVNVKTPLKSKCNCQFGLDPYCFRIDLLACATSVFFVSFDFGSGFCSIIFAFVFVQRRLPHAFVNRFGIPLSRLFPHLTFT